MTVDTEIDPDQTCPECGSYDILPLHPNDSSTTGISGGLQFLGLSRDQTVGRQYLHVEYQCPERDHEFIPRSDQDRAATGSAISSVPVDPSDLVTVLSPSGEHEMEVKAVGARLEVELPNGGYRFSEQIILDEPVDSDHSLVACDTEGRPIGLVWASSELVSIVTPFP